MDLDEFEKISNKILHSAIDDRSYLRELILKVGRDAQLMSLSRHYDALDKIVLWNSLDGAFQLRLHVYADPQEKNLTEEQIDIEEPHNHRWNFTTYVLSGGYQHTLYDRHLIPLPVRHEKVGDSYTLHHSQFHAIAHEKDTVTLLVRGPLEKENFQTIKDGHIKNAPILHEQQFVMDKDRYAQILKRLEELKIL